jgi:hypothetical protein
LKAALTSDGASVEERQTWCEIIFELRASMQRIPSEATTFVTASVVVADRCALHAGAEF